MFSSEVRYVPQGVLPAEQLAKVPSTRVPRGIGVRSQQLVAARRSVDVDRRARRDAPVLTRGQIASPAFRVAIELHHGDAVRRLHERDRVRMAVQPLLARIDLHAGAAMAGPDEFARSRIRGSRRRGRAPRDRTSARNRPRRRRSFRTDVPARHRVGVQPGVCGETASCRNRACRLRDCHPSGPRRCSDSRRRS